MAVEIASCFRVRRLAISSLVLHQTSASTRDEKPAETDEGPEEEGEEEVEEEVKCLEKGSVHSDSSSRGEESGGRREEGDGGTTKMETNLKFIILISARVSHPKPIL